MIKNPFSRCASSGFIFFRFGIQSDAWMERAFHLLGPRGDRARREELLSRPCQPRNTHTFLGCTLRLAEQINNCWILRTRPILVITCPDCRKLLDNKILWRWNKEPFYGKLYARLTLRSDLLIVIAKWLETKMKNDQTAISSKQWRENEFW